MVTPTQQTRETKARRPRDMALSMLVLIVPVFLLVGLYRFLGNETPPMVDTTEVYGSVQRAGQFELLKPEGLPSGWRVVSATHTDGVLRLGMTAPDDGALQLVETAKPAAEVVPAIVGRDARDDGEVTIAGRQWQRLSQGRPGERAIVQTGGGRTVIVVGQAKQSQLEQLAESLRP
ncbi:DUF4245 domain-containing protein [Dactylosporangium sp. NPDC000555]|uniref:DUF4245 domain-containing protein n=1 Tax=Dactylosporangium sp. NPDC000555 TaxID=3154260 RepID=UPI003319AA15